MAPRRRHVGSRAGCLSLALVGLFAGEAAAIQVGETVVGVGDAQVIADEPGTFELPFRVEREGGLIDGLRLLVETAPGGPNPGRPGEDYTPLPPGTEVLLDPGDASATVGVAVAGASAPGSDRTLLLKVTGAQAFTAAPRVAPTAIRIKVSCFTCSPAALATADLNGDGHLDLVTGNNSSGSLSVVLADGEGGFAEAVSYEPSGPISVGDVEVAVGDMTGDGHPDLVVGGFNPQAVEVFAGDGAGGLADPVAVPLNSGDSPPGVAVADVNGDSHLDIVTANGTSDTVSVLLGDGAGGFSAPAEFTTGESPQSLVVIDATGDGNVDIVTADATSRSVSVLDGDGEGQFAPPQTYSVGPDAAPRGVAVADVTGDGHLDLVTANRFDDGSDLPPLELSGTVSLLRGDGAGGFAEAEQLSLENRMGRADTVVIADVTGDGHPDIVVSRPFADRVSLLAGDGTGDFATPSDLPTGATPLGVILADLTGDGIVDVAAANSSTGSVSILPGDGAGGAGLEGNFDAGPAVYSVVTDDFNGDGHPDVATANTFGNSASLLLADREGGFAEAVHWNVGERPAWIVSGDVDGNGTVDLVTANTVGGSVSLLLGDGSGGFTDGGEMSVAREDQFLWPHAVAMADLNDDGHLDIVTANTGVTDEGVSVLVADGKGGFAEPVLYAVGADEQHQPQSVALADVTGDGYVDILTANEYNSTVSLLRGDGAGGFAEAEHLETGEGPVVVRVVDVTGDGHLDLVTLNTTTQNVSVLAADGYGGFEDAVHFAIYWQQDIPCNEDLEGEGDCPWPRGLEVADVTGDGHPDIVTGNTENDSVSILTNDGSGGFPSFEVFTTGASPGSVAVVDVTGDGNADVITGNRNGHNISVLASELIAVDLLNDEAMGVIISDPRSLHFLPVGLDLGAVEVGTVSAPQTALLQNLGTSEIRGLSFQMVGEEFATGGGTCGTTLPAGESCEVDVAFAPSVGGPAMAVLRVTGDQGNAAELALSGYGYGDGLIAPVGLELDPAASGGADGNGVFEPGELVEVAPAWRNDDLVARDLNGSVVAFTGPDGAEYLVSQAEADYGLVELGQIGSCSDTGVCYALGVSAPARRPVTHWDAAFEETVADDVSHTWSLHIGDSFLDVTRTSPFYPAIETLLHHGVTGGCRDAEYCPAAANTRAQIPVFLLKALDGVSYQPPACEAGSEVFSDVPAASPFCSWVEELARRGVVAGCGEDAYCPSALVTRAQMAVVLLKSWEGAGYSPPACQGLFDDVGCVSPFARWIEELAERGITAGCGETTYCPTAAVTRQQVAVFVTKTFGLTLYGP